MAKKPTTGGPQVVLRLLDVYGRPLDEPADLLLRRQETGTQVVVRGVQADPVCVGDCPGGVYMVQADPPSYLPVGGFVMSGGSLTLTFPVDANKVVGVTFPKYTDLDADAVRLLEKGGVLGYGNTSGQALYMGLDDTRRAGFLNIIAKSKATGLTNGRPVSSYFQALRELRGDRFFVVSAKELREEVKHGVGAGLFREASELLHRAPAGFEAAGSYKTTDHYGNLQLSFFANESEWVVDADIDDAAGLEHVFQVARNALTGKPTHPFDIHEVLIAYQRLDPGYRLRLH